MAQPVFVEEGEFFMWCFAEPEADGTWSASVTFERRADFAKGEIHIKGIRHLLDDSFQSEKEGLDAAKNYAFHMANHAADDIGL
jgi:hypothetical protein